MYQLTYICCGPNGKIKFFSIQFNPFITIVAAGVCWKKNAVKAECETGGHQYRGARNERNETQR